MKYKIPKTFMGRPIEGAMERALAREETPEPENRGPLTTSATINPSEYIQVKGIKGLHGKDVLISRYEIAGANNKNYEDSNRFVLEKGLYVPTPLIFMNHVSQVLKAHKENKDILDGNGNPISRDEVEDIYNHFTTNHIATYGNGTSPGAWTWLNSRFVPGSGYSCLDIETITGLEADGSFQRKQAPLEICAQDGQYVNFELNSQGLPLGASSTQEYTKGDNFYFYEPEENMVAWFIANSYRADLNCYCGPGGRVDSLGVFACAEGTRVGGG